MRPRSPSLNAVWEEYIKKFLDAFWKLPNTDEDPASATVCIFLYIEGW